MKADKTHKIIKRTIMQNFTPISATVANRDICNGAESMQYYMT